MMGDVSALPRSWYMGPKKMTSFDTISCQVTRGLDASAIIRFHRLPTGTSGALVKAFVRWFCARVTEVHWPFMSR